MISRIICNIKFACLERAIPRGGAKFSLYSAHREVHSWSPTEIRYRNERRNLDMKLPRLSMFLTICPSSWIRESFISMFYDWISVGQWGRRSRANNLQIHHEVRIIERNRCLKIIGMKILSTYCENLPKKQKWIGKPLDGVHSRLQLEDRVQENLRGIGNQNIF